MSTVFLNGEFLPKDEARISPDDRGFLLADGVYEVTPFYEGVPFGLDRHMERRLSLRVCLIDVGAVVQVALDLVQIARMDRAIKVDGRGGRPCARGEKQGSQEHQPECVSESPHGVTSRPKWFRTMGEPAC